MTHAPSPAHGPTRQNAIETITIEAPADTVWAAIKNFDALQNWHPAVAASPADKGNTVGSVRTIQIKGGGTLIETLESYDDAHKRYSYRIQDGGALPVTGYTSTLSVLADGGQSMVEWRSTFYRADRSDNPPPERNDAAALQAVTGVYRGGFDNLKKLLESK